MEQVARLCANSRVASLPSFFGLFGLKESIQTMLADEDSRLLGHLVCAPKRSVSLRSKTQR